MAQPTFHAVMHLIRANALIEERFSGELAIVHGLTLHEAQFLMHLNNSPLKRLTRVDVAKRLSVSASTVSRMASPLEKRGLVARIPDPRDARLVYAALTDAGGDLIADALATIERMSLDLFRDRWSAQDLAAFTRFLSRMTASLPGEIV